MGVVIDVLANHELVADEISDVVQAKTDVSAISAATLALLIVLGLLFIGALGLSVIGILDNAWKCWRDYPRSYHE